MAKLPNLVGRALARSGRFCDRRQQRVAVLYGARQKLRPAILAKFHYSLACRALSLLGGRTPEDFHNGLGARHTRFSLGLTYPAGVYLRLLPASINNKKQCGNGKRADQSSKRRAEERASHVCLWWTGHMFPSSLFVYCSP